MMHCPALSIVHLAGSDTSRNRQLLNECCHRVDGLAEVAYLCGPVIHLQVNVDMVVRSPRSQVILVPDTLEVCGELCRITRRTHQQISSVLKIECDESRVISTRLEPAEALISGYGISFVILSKTQTDPVKH